MSCSLIRMHPHNKILCIRLMGILMVFSTFHLSENRHFFHTEAPIPTKSTPGIPLSQPSLFPSLLFTLFSLLLVIAYPRPQYRAQKSHPASAMDDVSATIFDAVIQGTSLTNCILAGCVVHSTQSLDISLRL